MTPASAATLGCSQGEHYSCQLGAWLRKLRVDAGSIDIDFNDEALYAPYPSPGGEKVLPGHFPGSLMNKRFTQLQALTKQEWQVLLSSLFLLPSIAMALRIRGFKWTRAFLQNRIPLPPDSTTGSEPVSTDTKDKLETAVCVARMVAVAANHGPYRANCLRRSLATWWLLQRRGIGAELNIGVNTDSGDFKAHAWVEYRGNTLVEADDVSERFSTFGPQ